MGMRDLSKKVFKEVEHKTWKSLVSTLEGNIGSGFMYRGQTNDVNNCWSITSSFNRSYSSDAFLFESFLQEQYSDHLFDYFSDYSYEKISQIQNLEMLERLYYLQHYGLPTCLIDFTKDPLIATYFAISGVEHSNSFPLKYDEKGYVSIYQLNINCLPKELQTSILTSESLSRNYEKYEFMGYAHFGLDMNPEINLIKTENFNLEKQKGCFVLFDNLGNNEIGLYDFLEQASHSHSFGNNFWVHHKLCYKAIFERDVEYMDNMTLWGYLKSKKKIGRDLFNDIQGLKYDLNFFYA
jgi:hypothetical protein